MLSCKIAAFIEHYLFIQVRVKIPILRRQFYQKNLK